MNGFTTRCHFPVAVWPVVAERLPLWQALPDEQGRSRKKHQMHALRANASSTQTAGTRVLSCVRLVGPPGFEPGAS